MNFSDKIEKEMLNRYKLKRTEDQEIIEVRSTKELINVVFGDLNLSEEVVDRLKIFYLCLKASMAVTSKEILGESIDDLQTAINNSPDLDDLIKTSNDIVLTTIKSTFNRQIDALVSDMDESNKK
jgi:hypothetical protein